jgi:hypothetical protein
MGWDGDGNGNGFVLGWRTFRANSTIPAEVAINSSPEQKAAKLERLTAAREAHRFAEGGRSALGSGSSSGGSKEAEERVEL